MFQDCCIIRIIKAFCQCFETTDGQITLNQGRHEIVIETEVEPKEVFLSVSGNCDPVCVGDINMIGYALIGSGFILYADITSNTAEISYIVRS